VAYRSARADREARLAGLERLIQPRKPNRRTLDDVCAEHGLSEDEMQRFAHWLHLCLTLEERGELPDGQLEAEARWANCRFSHGPGLCGEACPGNFEGRGQDQVKPASAEAPTPEPAEPRQDEERRDIFAPNYTPFGGWDEEQTRANRAASERD
jgi:hypothetical protein